MPRMGIVNLLGGRAPAANVESSTAGAASATGTEPGAFARAHAATVIVANAAAIASSIRSHGRQMRKRISQVRHVGLRKANLRRNYDRRRNFEFRLQVAYHRHGRCDLLHGLLGQTSLRSLQFVAISTATAA